jgi:hypothetical protein
MVIAIRVRTMPDGRLEILVREPPTKGKRRKSLAYMPLSPNPMDMR